MGPWPHEQQAYATFFSLLSKFTKIKKKIKSVKTNDELNNIINNNIGSNNKFNKRWAHSLI